MPVLKDQYIPPDVSRFSPLQERLATELRVPSPFGQPLIKEERFARSGLLGVTVVWDAWEARMDVQRTTLILNAYEEVFGKEARHNTGFAIGFTEPEAVDAGVLPYAIRPLLRKADPPEWFDQCRQAMIELGASDAWKPGYPRLRLPTMDSANHYVEELIRRVPRSDDVWSVEVQPETSDRSES